MTMVRTAAVAGLFYPGDPDTLRATVDGFLNTATKPAHVSKALVVPHAGYIYSGPVAASAYAHLIANADTITRVVLLGPSHHVAFRGLAASSADRFVTPLGEIPVDRAAVERVLTLPQVRLFDHAHTREHSLEVQLPFLQRVLKSFQLVPLVVGDAPAEEVAQVLDALWGEVETHIIISSDLSHYLDYETARRMDHHTSTAIERLDYHAIAYEHACGRRPLNGLLMAAKHRGLVAATVDLRNSGDTAGPRDRVVGYGSYVFR